MLNKNFFSSLAKVVIALPIVLFIFFNVAFISWGIFTDNFRLVFDCSILAAVALLLLVVFFRFKEDKSDPRKEEKKDDK